MGVRGLSFIPEGRARRWERRSATLTRAIVSLPRKSVCMFESARPGGRGAVDGSGEGERAAARARA